jgi:hypothetical protein
MCQKSCDPMQNTSKSSWQRFKDENELTFCTTLPLPLILYPLHQVKMRKTQNRGVLSVNFNRLVSFLLPSA